MLIFGDTCGFDSMYCNDFVSGVGIKINYYEVLYTLVQWTLANSDSVVQNFNIARIEFGSKRSSQ